MIPTFHLHVPLPCLVQEIFLSAWVSNSTFLPFYIHPLSPTHMELKRICVTASILPSVPERLVIKSKGFLLLKLLPSLFTLPLYAVEAKSKQVRKPQIWCYPFTYTVLALHLKQKQTGYSCYHVTNFLLSVYFPKYFSVTLLIFICLLDLACKYGL